jgi:type VI secretion system protein ImpF
MSHNAMCFTIEAELWAQPLPLRLFLRTDLDLETGEVSVAEVTTGDEP